MRLPNNYGTVTRLSGNRRNPYVVRKTRGFDNRKYPIYDTIGYAPTREAGMILLAQYNSDPWDIDKKKTTFEELYKLWLEKKAPKLGASNLRGLKAAYNYCSMLYETHYKDIRTYHMQDVIDACEKSYATKNSIKNLFFHLDNFAFETDVINKKYSELTKTETTPETSKEPFTDDEVNRLWEISNEEWIDSILAFIYSGWRISELLGLECENIDLDARTMKGGVKTASGKNRIVPIHSKIYDFVKRRYDEGHKYLFTYDNGKKVSESQYYKIWDSIMERLGMKHTPHEARHTFRSRLDSAGANKCCIDLMMGHKSKEVGERIYTHKSLDELKEAIEMIKK